MDGGRRVLVRGPGKNLRREARELPTSLKPLFMVSSLGQSIFNCSRAEIDSCRSVL